MTQGGTPAPTTWAHPTPRTPLGALSRGALRPQPPGALQPDPGGHSGPNHLGPSIPLRGAPRPHTPGAHLSCSTNPAGLPTAPATGLPLPPALPARFPSALNGAPPSGNPRKSLGLTRLKPLPSDSCRGCPPAPVPSYTRRGGIPLGQGGGTLVEGPPLSNGGSPPGHSETSTQFSTSGAAQFPSPRNLAPAHPPRTHPLHLLGGTGVQAFRGAQAVVSFQPLGPPPNPLPGRTSNGFLFI